MNETNLEDEKVMKKRNKRIFIASCVFVLFVILGTILYPLLVSKPKDVFVNAIDKVISLSSLKRKEELLNKQGGSFNFKMNLSSDNRMNEKVFSILNALDFKMDYKVDYEEGKMQMNIHATYDDKDLLNTSMYFQQNEVYLYWKDIYSKYLKLQTSGMDNLFSISRNRDDYEIVMNYLQNGMKKALKDSYFSKETAVIEVSDKDLKVTKNNFLLTEENLEEIKDCILEELDHEEFINSYATISNSSKKQVEEMLQNLKTKELSLENDITFSIFTKGMKNEFVGFEIYEQENHFTIIKNSETKYHYCFDSSDSSVEGDLEFITNNDGFTLNIIIDSKEVNGTITYDFTKLNEIAIEDIPLENSKNVEDLTSQEQEEIFSSIQNMEGIKALIEDFALYFVPNLGI